ncbi:MAG: NAD(P)H-binding protein [Lactobacillaceae bacterium]|jgi:putative NADH-flavin reductase|nr:NAD(P)H-binding protein [Lactobacillaceae bacterium]
MNILVIGATGNAGSAIYKEAVLRNLEITGLVRDKEKGEALFGADSNLLIGDVNSLDETELGNYDFVINAYANRSDVDSMLPVAQKIAGLVKSSNSKLVQLIGASSLFMDDGRTVLEHQIAKFGDVDWIEEPKIAIRIYEWLKTRDDFNWLAVSPNMNLIDGLKTNYVIGKDQIIYDKNHQANVAVGNYAAGILDVLQKNELNHTRFTVADA